MPLQVLADDGPRFRELVGASLRRQCAAINRLADAGMFFWDYGNAFLLEAKRCGAEVDASDDPTGLKFRYPSYVQDIMGYSLSFHSLRHLIAMTFSGISKSGFRYFSWFLVRSW